MSTMPTTYREPHTAPASLLDADEAWRAVERRDPRFDGRFVYAVGSTSVYCRPSCPSRRPLRKNVNFFEDPDAAELAGFRACKRCRPRARATPVAQAVESARRYLERHPDRVVTLATLGEVTGVSAFHLQRSFKRILGVTPKQYHDSLRVSLFKERLRAGDTVSRATYEAGFGSSSRVYERSNGALGMTPAVFGRGGAGMRITFTVVNSPFGKLLVGATDRGVCSIALGESVDALESALRRDFPQAEVVRGDDAHRDWVEEIVGHIGGGNLGLDVPLDVHGTAFQKQVWALLRKIPAGRTKSYSEIAAALGRPKAARAVARACASNRLAVVIPCHRVVRGDGSSGGYRWGTERKERLLAAEAGNRRR